MRKYWQIIIFLIFSCSTALSQIPPTPEQILGFKIGDDYQLADLQQINHYFTSLAENSNRVMLENLGFTTEGNTFFIAIISSAENLAALDRFKQIQSLLADPRKIDEIEVDDLIEEGKTIVSVNCSIHSTEIGASQMSMQLAYELATANTPEVIEILNNVIILLIPAHNPDGLNIVVNWYRKYLGTPYEGCGLPRLYHKYTGHDLNRDWYLLTQKETRLTVEKIYNEWHPQIVLDMHQTGAHAPRLFLPPYTDPYDPYMDPILTSEIAMLGCTIAADLTAQGFQGIITNRIFDAWAPSRAYMHYHAGIRILSEVASCNLASPVMVDLLKEQSMIDTSMMQTSWTYLTPWYNGEWRLADIVRYDKAVAFSLLTHAAKYRKKWLKNFYQIGKNAVSNTDRPYAFIIPQNQRDKSLVFELLQILHRGQLEIHQALEDFYVQGCMFAAGSYIILMNQPYAAYAKTLLSVQHYPQNVLKKSYDISGHTLPFLFGVKAIPVDFKFDVALRQCEDITLAPGKMNDRCQQGRYLSFSNKSNYSYKAMNFLLAAGYDLHWLKIDITDGEKYLGAGTIIMENKRDTLLTRKIADDWGCDIEPVSTDLLSLDVLKIKRPHIALYKSWIRSDDEGWTRFVLDEYGFDYDSATDSVIQAGNLHSKYDIILLPDLSTEAIVNGNQQGKMPPEFCHGLGKTGVQNIKKFVQNGGTLISINLATKFVVETFELPITTVESTNIPRFWAPGPIVRMCIDNRKPLGFGSPSESSIIFTNNLILKAGTGERIAWYSQNRLLLSGALEGEKVLSNMPLILQLRYGAGKIILFGFRPVFRALTRGSYKLLFNSILLANAISVKLEITDSF